MIHLLAVAQMDPVVRTLFYAVAIVCFGLAAFAPEKTGRVGIGWVGLALAFTPPFWDSLAAT